MKLAAGKETSMDWDDNFDPNECKCCYCGLQIMDEEYHTTHSFIQLCSFKNESPGPFEDACAVICYECFKLYASGDLIERLII